MITERQRSSLRLMLQSEHFYIIEELAKEFCRGARDNIFLRDTQWETLKEFLLQEGKCRGVKDFIVYLINEASKQKTNE